jgi:hypothetical protein
MKILFIAPDYDEHRASYEALKAAAPEHQVIWCEGVFHDLYKNLPEKIYFRQIEPEVKGGHNIVSFAPNEFQIALIDMSHDEKWEGVLNYAGAARPDEIIEVLTWVGTICLGTSREGKYLNDLTGKGAVLACAQEQLPKKIKGMLVEAVRMALACQTRYTLEGLRAITLRQPWAMSVFTCGKDIENRQWMTQVRGTVAIHVAEEQPEGSFEQGAAFINEVLRRTHKRGKSPAFDRTQCGKIIGLVDFGDNVSESASPWFEGPLGLSLTNARLLPKPVPCTVSKRRFWVLDKPTRAAIYAQLPPLSEPDSKAPAKRKSPAPTKRPTSTKRRATGSRSKGSKT